jgi:hypothetical protein
LSYVGFIKDKAIPLQAWRGPQGVRRLRLPNFKTIKVVVPLGKYSWYSFLLEAAGRIMSTKK